LTRSADSAMYLAKRQGRNCYRIFSQDLNEKMESCKKMELKLKQAIQDNNFILHFQPLFDLTRGRTVAMEALLRWVHPETGKLSNHREVASFFSRRISYAGFLWAWSTHQITRAPLFIEVRDDEARRNTALRFKQLFENAHHITEAVDLPDRPTIGK